ncbi:hypothetical protein [Roseibium sediminis]|uniref:hypothetical protein n=1 Tax=Roseibium sediminis TaxID=1775174 RepID=UPI00123CE913|nr:hypothetical protein [Roseibium sediminis]
MSKRLFAALVAGAVSVSTAALAQGVAFEDVDSNADGVVSFEEISAVITTVTEDAFKAADANQDGSLDADEFESIQQ